jgi:hypothetical protein
MPVKQLAGARVRQGDADLAQQAIRRLLNLLQLPLR